MKRFVYILVFVLIGSSLAVAGKVAFNPTQTSTTSAPIVGLGATDSHYLLTNPTVTATLDRNFSGNNQEVPSITNPSYAQDAASFNNEYMFQLGVDNNIRTINLADGSYHPSMNIFSAGAYSFGIGYDFISNSIGIGNFNPNTSVMTFSVYSLSSGELSVLCNFPFDTSAYGTPSGLDFLTYGGELRAIVGTRDAPGENPWDSNLNYVLDMNALTGSIDQWLTTPGCGNKLQDLLYSNGQLVLGYQSGGSGYIEAGSYTPFSLCRRFDISGDLIIDLSDFAYIAANWLNGYDVSELTLFARYWLTACE